MKLLMFGVGMAAGMLAALTMSMCLTFMHLFYLYDEVLHKHVDSLTDINPEVFFGKSYKDPIIDMNAQKKINDLYLSTKLDTLGLISEILRTSPQKCNNVYDRVVTLLFILGEYEREDKIFEGTEPFLNIVYNLCVLEMLAAVALLYGIEKNSHMYLWPWFLVNCSYFVSSILVALVCFLHDILVLAFVVTLLVIPFRLFAGVAVAYEYTKMKAQA